MLKRLLSILLLFLYLIPSIGVCGSVHYCGGEIAAIVIIPSNEHPCACGPDEPMDGSCCQDKAFSFKIKDNHKSTDAQTYANDVFDVLAFLTYLNYSIPPRVSITKHSEVYIVKDTDAPDDRLYVLYESYLI